MVPVRPSDPVRFSASDVTASFTSIYLASPQVGQLNLTFALNVIGLNGTNITIYGSMAFNVIPGLVILLFISFPSQSITYVTQLGPAVSLLIPTTDNTPIHSDAYVPLPEYVVCALDAGGSYANIADSPINITATLSLPTDAYGSNATATSTQVSSFQPPLLSPPQLMDLLHSDG